MIFNSSSYLLFLAIVYLIHYVTPHRWRWLPLLGAGYLFYAFLKVPYLPVILILVTGISYGCGIAMAAQQEEARRRRWFWSGVSACVAVLVLLKYLPFFQSPMERIFGFNNAGSSTVITIGVSYFTFQAISYLADIYLGMEQPERHPGYFALYLSFFPKLLQGPLERGGDLLPQLKKTYRFDYGSARTGVLLFVWGLFKKVVIADRLSEFVATVYGNLSSSSSLSVLLATYCYAVQIYCDFSGYTDMALGTALLFNIRLTQNFKNPYLATSMADFWRRWHISFSRWLFDYIFKPLQMQWRDWPKGGTACALLVTFLVSGLWHGATWGFLVWGLLHGSYLASSIYYRPLQKKIYRGLGLENSRLQRLVQTVMVFHLVCFAWIFFRAKSLGDAFIAVDKILHVTLREMSFQLLRNTVGGLGMTQADLGIFIVSFIFVSDVSVRGLRSNDFEKLFRSPLPVRWLFYITLTLLVVLGARMNSVPYLYFQF